MSDIKSINVNDSTTYSLSAEYAANASTANSAYCYNTPKTLIVNDSKGLWELNATSTYNYDTSSNNNILTAANYTINNWSTKVLISNTSNYCGFTNTNASINNQTITGNGTQANTTTAKGWGVTKTYGSNSECIDINLVTTLHGTWTPTAATAISTSYQYAYTAKNNFTTAGCLLARVALTPNAPDPVNSYYVLNYNYNIGPLFINSTEMAGPSIQYGISDHTLLNDNYSPYYNMSPLRMLGDTITTIKPTLSYPLLGNLIRLKSNTAISAIDLYSYIAKSNFFDSTGTYITSTAYTLKSTYPVCRELTFHATLLHI